MPLSRAIQLLPPQLANQIAAGEVVERPASVVKELLENSVDAGARHIEVNVEQGGVRLIRITDDGHGIPRDELCLALAPHATSKLYTQEELIAVNSLGFRGEALASIASVSRLTLSSHAVDSEQGWEVKVAKGECGEATPVALTAGTRIEVRDLFHAIPARRKFLRSERTEFLHIEEVVRRIALSRFDVGFTLQHNDRQIFRLRPATDPAQQSRRVAEVLSRKFVEQSRQIQFAASGLQLWGWLSAPSASRSQADQQYFYLNGRMIRDRLIQHAIRQAHQGVLDTGRHPAFVLYLQIEPHQVDVNVHPTKHEVRFREPRLVHDFLQRALRSTVEETPDSTMTATQQFGQEERQTHAIGEQQVFYHQASEKTAQRPTDSVRTILHGRYLLSGAGDTPYLLDMQAARETLLGQHWREMLERGEISTRPLLIPQTLTLSSTSAEKVLAASEVLAGLGLELTSLGEENLALRQIPALLDGADAAGLLQRIVAWVLQEDHDTSVLIDVLVSEAAAQPLRDLAMANRLLDQVMAMPGQGEAFRIVLSDGMLQQLFVSGNKN